MYFQYTKERFLGWACSSKVELFFTVHDIWCSIPIKFSWKHTYNIADTQKILVKNNEESMIL